MIIRGTGVGLRAQHFSYILENLPPVPWFEVLTDNYLNEGGVARANLQRVCEHYPIVLHGVGLSLGSTDPLDSNYLHKLKNLATHLQPSYISDHLSWVSVNGQHTHQLLPLPYTEEAITHVVQRIAQTQDFLQQRILIENVSSYLNYNCSEMTEWEFLTEVAQRADCYILLDINNIFVSATNQNYNPYFFLQHLPQKRVKQYHLAGYESHGKYLLDTHSALIATPVWELYEKAIQLFGTAPALIEWDAKIPDFSVLLQEVDKAQHIASGYRALFGND